MTRREDFRLVTGQGRYSADWRFADQLEGAFLRADRAHAEIVRLDASRALAHGRRASGVRWRSARRADDARRMFIDGRSGSLGA
jgi:carbon-monoxide dehydrogenase large subunit